MHRIRKSIRDVASLGTMQPHTNLLLAKILLVIAAVLVVMNLRSPSSAS